MPIPAPKDRYTYGDYVSWPDDERWELIDGVPFNMTPAPSRLHQDICMELSRQISNHLLDSPCRVYAAPFDVRFPQRDEADHDVTTVVQPDIVVVCDPARLDAKGCRGAPDVVIEVVSPTTLWKDLGEKLALYERHAVQEYWIVHPEEQYVMVFLLQPDGKYGRHELYTKNQKPSFAAIAGLSIDLERVFSSSHA